jgi:hypothetical protein
MGCAGKMCIEVDPTSKISFISEEVRVDALALNGCRFLLGGSFPPCLPVTPACVWLVRCCRPTPWTCRCASVVVSA